MPKYSDFQFCKLFIAKRFKDNVQLGPYMSVKWLFVIVWILQGNLKLKAWKMLQK